MSNSYGSTFPTPGHYEMLIRGERALNNVQPLIAKAEACGVDCAQFRDGHAGMQQFFAAVRQQFWPDAVIPPSGANVPHASD